MPAPDAMPPSSKAFDRELVRLIRELACCPAVGESAPAVEAARAWVDQQAAKPLEIVRKRPEGQTRGESYAKL